MPKITKAGLLAWLGQKTTILGIAGLAGIAAGAASGELTVSAAITLGVPALVAIIMPESADASGDAGQLAQDTLKLVASKGTGGTALLVAQDGLRLAGDLHPYTPVLAVSTTLTPGPATAG